jgi:hypothetical protein
MNDQPETDYATELTRRRLATVLTKAGIPDDTKSVNEWHGLFLRARFKPDKMADALQRLLERCFDMRIVVKYAQDAEQVFMEEMPRRHSSDYASAIEQMEAKIREEQRQQRERVMADPVMRKDYFALRKRMGLGPLTDQEDDDAANAPADQGRDLPAVETSDWDSEPPAPDQGVLPLPVAPSDPRPVATDQADAVGRSEVGAEVVGSGWDDETPF